MWRWPGTAHALIETDPRFANYQSWLSSDYLLEQLHLDPATAHKRLGDGFYEQQLVREQLLQLTGRRFLEGYASDEAQYQALMAAGATYAQQWQLTPGVALTAEQMAQLTTDIVWLVEERVLLADGSTQQVLVPQLYVWVQPGDIDGNGALLSGGRVDLQLSGDLTNSGTLAGRDKLKLSGETLNNLAGRLSGGDVTLLARQDLNNLAGAIDAATSLTAIAGRDIRIESATSQTRSSQGSQTNVSRLASVYVGSGSLLLSAGQDVKLVGASIVNAGTGPTTVDAARDVKLGTLTQSRQRRP